MKDKFKTGDVVWIKSFGRVFTCYVSYRIESKIGEQYKLSATNDQCIYRRFVTRIYMSQDEAVKA